MLNRMAAGALASLTDCLPELLAMANGVAVDSRLLKKGDIFFALDGEKVDGHDYLEEVARKGAIAAVVSETYFGQVDLPLIRVDDPLKLLQDVARTVVQFSKAKIVAVTGSVGKTTTKDFIAHLISEKYLTASSPGNSNSQIGLPLAILNHTHGDEEVIILEMGMTHGGQIANLVNIAPPDIAVITAVGLVHACNFDGIEQIAESKAEIFSNPRTRFGIINRSSSCFNKIVEKMSCPYHSYGDGVIDLENGIKNLQFDKLPLLGKHNLDNFLAAALVAKQLGMEWSEIAERAKTITLPQKRLQKVEKNGVLYIDDSYNAAPLSIKAAIDAMPEPLFGNRKIAVLGSMLELGKFSDACHHEIGEYALGQIDLLFCLGNECLPIQNCWNNAGRQMKMFLDRSELVQELKKIVMSGDVVLLKGSLASGVWKIIEEI
ncbi:MAG: UDP-N-acetylmuramoyl-tripeptide--D-alanyl-D-alanine ligase [Parachlamydiaceae bacterium]|nr:UDP-N-acetylmuramoyl-tripeptide--D-alanyl-D-alanine ligase [Parachlamydiaceae bacterium]